MVAPRAQAHAQAALGVALAMEKKSGELRLPRRRHLVLGSIRVLVATTRRSRCRRTATQHKPPSIVIAGDFNIYRPARAAIASPGRCVAIHARSISHRTAASPRTTSFRHERARPHARRRRFIARRQSRRRRHTYLWRRVQSATDSSR